jgi:hypothetical protein
MVVWGDDLQGWLSMIQITPMFELIPSKSGTLGVGGGQKVDKDFGASIGPLLL